MIAANPRRCDVPTGRRLAQAERTDTILEQGPVAEIEKLKSLLVRAAEGFDGVRRVT
jgi:hypothetical protein